MIIKCSPPHKLYNKLLLLDCVAMYTDPPGNPLDCVFFFLWTFNYSMKKNIVKLSSMSCHSALERVCIPCIQIGSYSFVRVDTTAPEINCSMKEGIITSFNASTPLLLRFLAKNNVYMSFYASALKFFQPFLSSMH